LRLTPFAFPKDDGTAYAWFNLAAYTGSDSGSIARDEVAKQMTLEQIAEAQKLSKELIKPKVPKLSKELIEMIDAMPPLGGYYSVHRGDR
jgi:hypothetical protein